MIATIKLALREILAQRLSPSERETLAASLEAIAAEQRRIAEAQRRQEPPTPREAAVRRRRGVEESPRKTGRPLGSGGSFVKWDAPLPGRRSGNLHIAPKLWRGIGEPPYVDVQRVGGRLELSACGADQGWKVTLPSGERGGLPRMSIGQEPAATLGLVEGKFEAAIIGRRIVVL